MGFFSRAVKRRSVWMTFGAILVVAGAASATTILFSQTFPAVTTANLTAGCSTITADNAATSAGSVVFDCAGTGPAETGSAAAFVATAAGSFKPSFGGVASGDTLSVFPSADTGVLLGTTACSAISGDLPLTSGTAVALSAQGWDYCYQLGTGHSAISAFAITWSQ